MYVAEKEEEVMGKSAVAAATPDSKYKTRLQTIFEATPDSTQPYLASRRRQRKEEKARV